MVAFPRNEIGKPQRALTHIRTAATRGSVVIIAGPRHLWEENWESESHGLLFFETLC